MAKVVTYRPPNDIIERFGEADTISQLCQTLGREVGYTYSPKLVDVISLKTEDKLLIVVPNRVLSDREWAKLYEYFQLRAGMYGECIVKYDFTSDKIVITLKYLHKIDAINASKHFNNRRIDEDSFKENPFNIEIL